MKTFAFLTIAAGLAWAQPAYNSYRYTFGNKFANFPNFPDPTAEDPEKNQCTTTDGFWGNPVCKAVDVESELYPMSKNIVQPPAFTGAGLNDLTVGGSFNDVSSDTVFYDVEIDSMGAPDTFKWRRGSGAYTTGVAITGTAQAIEDGGVTLTFGHTAGHTLGNKWRITCHKPLYRAEPSCPRWPLDNADGSMYFIGANALNSSVFVRSGDNSVVEMSPIYMTESNEPRWDHADPDLLYYRSGCRLFGFRVSSGSSTLVHDFAVDFPACTAAKNDTEGDSSPDSRYWAFMILGEYLHGANPLLAVVVYDKRNDRIVGTLDRARYIAQGGCPDLWDTYGYRPNMVDIAPTGDRVLLLWPAVDYPVPYMIGVSNDPATVAGGTRLTVSGQAVMTRWFVPGDTARMSCSGALAAASGFRTVTAVGAHSLEVDVSGLGLSSGNYAKGTCGYAGRNAILSLEVSGGTATVTGGNEHRLQAKPRIALYGVPGISDGASLAVTGTLDGRRFTFQTALADGSYTAAGMYWRDPRDGVHIKDDDFSFPELKASNEVANDGAHVYHLDFSAPLKVANGQPHTGWSWDLNGDPVLLWYCNKDNWKKGKPDFFSATNIYTGDVIPVFSHQDMNYESTEDHFPRIYDRKVRGWGIAGFASYPGATNPLRNQIVAFELKPYTEHPEIWRITTLHNIIVPRHGGYRDDGYWMEAPTGPNRAFTRLYWGAYWQGSNPGGALDSIWINTYYVDLPLRLRSKGSFEIGAGRTGTEISYIGSTSDACYVTVSTHPDLSEALEDAVADAGGNQYRRFHSAAAEPGRAYYYQVDCGWDVMAGQFTVPLSLPSADVNGKTALAGRTVLR